MNRKANTFLEMTLVAVTMAIVVIGICAAVVVAASIIAAAQAGVIWYLWNHYIAPWQAWPRVPYLAVIAALLILRLAKGYTAKPEDKEDATKKAAISFVTHLAACGLTLAIMWILELWIS